MGASRPRKLQRSLSREAAAGPLKRVVKCVSQQFRHAVETEFWELASSFEAGRELWEPAGR